MFLDYFALFLVFFVAIVIFYGIIVIHDIPYEIAAKRNHPHQDALHVAGWVSLFTLHVLWPFLWIWATIYKPGVGWGFKTNESSSPGPGPGSETPNLQAEIQQLKMEIAEIKSSLEDSNQKEETKVEQIQSEEKGS